MPELDLRGNGRNPSEHRSASKTVVTTEKKSSTGAATMDAIVAREGVLLALRALERNAGEAGVDGTTKEQPLGYLRTHWEPVKSQLLAG